MRKLILAMQISLDGFIEGPNGDMSWIQPDDPEGWDDLFEMLESVDLFLLGRVMFSDYRNYWKQALVNPRASANEIKYARLAEKTKHIVFSSSSINPEWGNTEMVNGNVAVAVEKLKKQQGKDIQIVGGAKLAATLINAGLVDEYRLNINPVLLGKGKLFFRDQYQKSFLEMINAKPLKSGVLIVRYIVKK